MGPALPTLDPRLSARERERVARRPVSRVLSNPCGPGRPFVWDAPYSAPHATNPGDGARTPLRHLLSQDRRPPLFGLAPGGVYPAAPVTGGAVRSYRTVSPLPSGRSAKTGRREGGLFSVALSLGSPPPAVNRHRVPVEPGLSSTPLQRQRPSSRLTGGVMRHPVAPVNPVPFRMRCERSVPKPNWPGARSFVSVLRSGRTPAQAEEVRADLGAIGEARPSSPHLRQAPLLR